MKMYFEYTKTTKGVKKIAALILVVACTFNAYAYRLKDGDVTVVNGVITHCSYDMNLLGNRIEIPEVLDGQTITGLGDNCFSLSGKIREVTLPATLKTIGSYVFQDHNLTNVILPDGIRSIGYSAFSNNNIETVNLPNTLTTIRNSAFYNNKIKSIKIPIGLSIIESSAFRNNRIEELTIPPNIDSIQGIAFANNLIKSLFIPNTLYFLGNNAFSENGLEQLTFEDGCKLSQISSSCFRFNKLTNVKLPNSISIVDQYAFADNSLLTSVSLNSGLKKIGKHAFQRCKLTSVDLPNGLFYIGSGVFALNPMTSFKLPNQTMGNQWTVGDGTKRNNGEVITDLTLSYIVRIPYTLKDEDVVVSNGTINHCSYTRNIENYGNAITIPETLDGQTIKSIGKSSFSDGYIFEINLPKTLVTIQYGAFSYCELTDLFIPASVESIGEVAFLRNNIRNISFEEGSRLKTIENDAFSSNKIINLTIPGNVTKIGRNAFFYNNISSLTFSKPSLLIALESGAFRYNTTLINMTLPESIISGYIYQGWVDGYGVIHQSSQNNLTVTDFETFYKVLLSYTLTDDDVIVKDGIIISTSYDFTASNIVIPEMLDGQVITGIENGAFFNKGITDVTLPPKLEYLGANAFGNNFISEITIPASTDSIASSAFINNTITNLTFEENSEIRYIGKTAFWGNQIDTLIIPKSVEQIEAWAFTSSQIKYLGFEDGSRLISIGEHAFYNNRIQNDLILPPLLKEIGKSAFANNLLGHITLNDNLIYIGEGAFTDNPKVTITPLPSPETIPFVTWFIRWRDSNNNTLYPGYVITDFSKGYQALIDKYLNVKFQVNDESGFAIAGATIRFSDSLMVTNALGTDSIAPVLRGKHNYVVKANGYLTYSGSVDVQNNTYLKIIMNRLFVLNIKVVDKDNNPLQNVQIEIGDSILISNTQGEASLKLINGNYLCTASLPGFSMGSAHVEIHNTNASITIPLNPAVITYHPNGGAGSTFSENATSSTYKIKNNSFTRLGYRFAGYNTKADGSGTSIAEGTNFTLDPGDLDLFATWQTTVYKITYELQGGQNDLSNPVSYTINSSTIQLKPAIPTAQTEAYFEGWIDMHGKKVESIPHGSTGDISVWASYNARPSYVINFENMMNGTHPNPSEYTRLDLPMTFKQASQNGYNFLGWYSDSKFKNKIESLAEGSIGDTTFYARWEAIGYKIQYVLNGGTNSLQNTEDYTIESNTITLQAASKQGYTFAGWFVDESFTKPTTSIPKGSIGNWTLYAKWELKTYSIQYVLNGGENSPQNPASYSIETNTITLKAASKQGSAFKGWFTDKNLTKPITAIPIGNTGDLTFYAKWNLLYLVNLEITTDGSTPAPGISVIINNADPLVSDKNGKAKLYYENNLQYSYRLELDNIEITSGTGILQNADQVLKIEIVNAFMRWNDVIFCDNGTLLWKSFEWQKSGKTISNEQFYYKEGGIESGQYTLKVTSQSGKQYVWTKNYQNNLFSMSFYPNPVLKSQELTIEINGLDEPDDCELLIYNSLGQVVDKKTKVGTLNQLQLNSAISEGIYLMVLTQKGKHLSSKQLIVR
jgi:uncharacterized repeat protein (TIGR02543 family)